MSVVEFFSQPVWHRLSLALVHFWWQGLAVAVLACAAVRLLKLKRGNRRYVAYLLAFALMAACPALTFMALGVSAAPPVNAAEPTPAIEPSESAPRPMPSDPRYQFTEHTASIRPTGEVSRRERLNGAWQTALPWVLVFWMAGVLILSARLLLAWIGVWRWRRDLEPLAEGLQVRVALLAERLGVPGFSRVFTSRDAREAVAMGYLRPMVLLPAALLTRMPPEMLEAVIAHELAHIRRFDLWVNLAQRIIETLLFYHPAVWWLSSRLRSERELCCDDLAVKTTGERLAYVSALENAARIHLVRAQLALALEFGQSTQPTLGRVRHVLGLPSAPPDSRFWLAGVVGLLVPAILMMYTSSSRGGHAGPSQEAGTTQVGSSPHHDALPPGWTLDYDDGRRAGGVLTWPAEMAMDLASLECSATGLGMFDASRGNERYEFEIRSSKGERLGTIQIPASRPDILAGRKILKPDKYAIHYTRRFGSHGDNVRVHAGPFPVDLSPPGMHELRFTPTLGSAQITGSLGGCYALNLERIDGGFNVFGCAYQNASKDYVIGGLPAGTYRLSAVTQDDSGNVFVSQAQATVKADESLTVDMAPPPRGACSLHGVIAGKRGTYWPPTPIPQQTKPQWFVLIRTQGSGPIEQTNAYEAQTMDSHYAIRGDSIVQETEDQASYSISGIAPGEYTVTAIEHPWYQGLPIKRQQSRSLTLQPGETATLDFDLSTPAEPRPAPIPRTETGTSDEPSREVTCTGRVTDDRGRPVAGARVAAYEMHSDGVAGNMLLYQVDAVTTSSDGAFAFTSESKPERGRFVESYIVAARENTGIAWAVWNMRESVEADLRLGEPTVLAGVIVDDAGQHVADAEVRANLYRMVATADGGKKREWLPGIPPLQELLTRTDAQGKFVFGNLPADTSVDLLARAPGKATIYTYQTALGQPAFTSGRTDIRIVLPPEARIEGRLLNSATGKGVPRTHLAVVDPSGLFFYRFVCATDAEGRFSIGGLRPGPFHIRADYIPGLDVEVKSGQTTRVTMGTGTP